MKYSYLLSCTLFMVFYLSYDVQGQYHLSTEWAKKIGSPNEDEVNYIKSFENGNFIITGKFFDSLNVETNPELSYLLDDDYPWGERACAFVAKYTENGDVIWARKFRDFKILDFVITNDNGIAFTGFYSSTSFDADPGEGEYSLSGASSGFAVVKLDENGDFSWAASGSSEHLDGGITMSTIEGDSDNNIYIGGTIKRWTQFYSASGVGRTFELHYRYSKGGYVIKIDPEGEFLWWELIECFSLTVDKIIIDNADRLVVSGSTNNGFYVDPFGTDQLVSLEGTYSSPYIIYFTLDGEFSAALALNSFRRFIDMEIDGAKNIYLALTYEDFIDADHGPGVDNMYSFSGDMGAIIKLNSTANYLWGNSYAAVTNIELDHGENIVAYGRRFVDPLLTDDYICLFGINSNGEDLYTDSLEKVITDYTVNTENSLVAIGEFIDEQEFDTEIGDTVLYSEGENDIFLLKKNYGGLLDLESRITQQSNIFLYPNPTADLLTIQSKEIIKSVQVHDLAGNVLISLSSNVLSLGSLASGFYCITVETESGFFTQKVVKT